jgi:hypothetical protein
MIPGINTMEKHLGFFVITLLQVNRSVTVLQTSCQILMFGFHKLPHKKNISARGALSGTLHHTKKTDDTNA